MAGEMLTLDDVATPRALELVVEPPGARARAVRGVHCTDYPHPASYIDADWIVLTNGNALRGKTALQASLVDGLADVGATALGFGLGDPFPAPPPALVRRARERELAVFTVPMHVSFVDITRDVYEATLHADARTFLRLSAIQAHLIDALTEEDAEQSILDRLSSMTSAATALVAVDGRVLRTSRGGRVTDIPRLHESQSMLVEPGADGKTLVGVPVAAGPSEVQHWVVAQTAQPPQANRLVKRAVQVAAPLLAAATALQRSGRARQRQLKAELLQRLEGDRAGAEAPGITQELGAYGLGLDGPWWVVTCGSVAAGELAFDAWCDRALTHLESSGRPFLGRCFPGELEVLLEGGEDDVDAAVDRLLAELGPAAGAGVSRPMSPLDPLGPAMRDARVALDRLRADRAAGRMHHRDLPLELLLLSQVPFERVQPQVEALLAPLQDQRWLWETLETFFANDLSVTATAAALHVHPNTLRYRLHRIETLLDRPLTAPATIAAVHLALTTARTAGAPAPTPS